jgi:ABC-2 type transport system ATP-binding protein
MFGDFCAVRDVSFTVRHGEVFGLLGANGAGKTTLFRMLCGLLPLSAGQATVAGADLRRARAQARSRIGYMAQKFSLYTNLSVGQNLEFYSSAYGLPRAQRHERVDWALETFELTASKRSRAGELPLGYQQRLALAAALMHRPEVLFLDEPTSGVDPIARRDFWRQINALVESGVTVLVTTHFLEEAEYCDRLVIMAEGAILAEGTPSDVKAAAQRAGAPSPNMEEAFISLIEQRDLPETGA